MSSGAQWSNGSTRAGVTGPGVNSLGPGDSHRATSSGLPLTPPAAVDVGGQQARPQHGVGVPAGRVDGGDRLMRPSVRVPVLSVTSTSMSPRSSMQTSRLTSTLRRASRRDPVARLVLTTAGKS